MRSLGAQTRWAPQRPLVSTQRHPGDLLSRTLTPRIGVADEENPSSASLVVNIFIRHKSTAFGRNGDLNFQYALEINPSLSLPLCILVVSESR